MRLPEYVHDANVAGLNAKTKFRDPRPMLVPDNSPSLEWVMARIDELEGDLDAQTALFEALPLEMQNDIWDLWSGKKEK